MDEARKMGKSELFSHFAERFDIKRTQSREFFDELAMLCEKELKRTGEFVIPGLVKLVRKETKARTGRNPATGQPIPIATKTVVKARIQKQLKDAVLPKKATA
jgi:DNA-binding protein HU-beta